MFSVVGETMLGRHVQPGNGRKRKRAVWPPLLHLLGDTGNQEMGRRGWDMEVQHGGKGGNCEETEVWLRRIRGKRG